MKTSKISIVIGALIIFASGCKSDKSTFKQESGVFTEYMDTSIKPGDNFYKYANGNWIKATEIPPPTDLITGRVPYCMRIRRRTFKK